MSEAAKSTLAREQKRIKKKKKQMNDEHKKKTRDVRNAEMSEIIRKNIDEISLLYYYE